MEELNKVKDMQKNGTSYEPELSNVEVSHFKKSKDKKNFELISDF